MWDIVLEMQSIWEIGIPTQSVSLLCNCTACVWALCFNGLHKSTVMSVRNSRLWFKVAALFARVNFWKLRMVNQEIFIGYLRLGLLSSLLDLFTRWK